MIDPHTAPGTAVVCISTTPDCFGVIVVGQTYHVTEIVECPWAPRRFATGLVEVPSGACPCCGETSNWFFALHLFRYKDLPEEITMQLATRKAPVCEPA